MIVGPPAHPPAAASVVSATAANVEDDLRHCEAHRSTCGGYAQQRFVHGNRELAGGGRFGAFSIPPPATPIPPRASSKCDGAMKKDAGAAAVAADLELLVAAPAPSSTAPHEGDNEVSDDEGGVPLRGKGGGWCVVVQRRKHKSRPRRRRGSDEEQTRRRQSGVVRQSVRGHHRRRTTGGAGVVCRTHGLC